MYFVDPITKAQKWHKAMISGVPTPGSIPKGGIKGFDRKTGWDVQTGKGSDGGTLNLTTRPPMKGSLTLQLFTEQDFIDWGAYVEVVLEEDPAVAKVEGLTIYHPALVPVGLTRVVIESYSIPQHQGKGLYHVTINMIEWRPPPPKNISQTVNSTAADESTGSNALPPQDPRAAREQTQIAALNQAIRKKKSELGLK